MQEKRIRRAFTKEFKAEIVRLILDGGLGIPDVCRDHDLSSSSVYEWVRQARTDRGDGSPGALTTSERAELAKLRREIRELRRERDFFEKATVYFAKGKP